MGVMFHWTKVGSNAGDLAANSKSAHQPDTGRGRSSTLRARDAFGANDRERDARIETAARRPLAIVWRGQTLEAGGSCSRAPRRPEAASSSAVSQSQRALDSKPELQPAIEIAYILYYINTIQSRTAPRVRFTSAENNLARGRVPRARSSHLSRGRYAGQGTLIKTSGRWRRSTRSSS